MLTSTDFPLRATALALKRGGRSLGIGVLLTLTCVLPCPFFESGLVMIVVTCGGFYIFAWRSRLMAISALHRGASHGPCMAALWFHWGLIDLHILPPIYRQLHFLYEVTASLPQ